MMKTILFHGMAALAFAICSPGFAAEPFLKEVEAGLYKDPEGVIPTALAKEKIIFFFFSGSTCGPCRDVKPLLLDLVDRHKGIAQLVHVNYDKDEKTMINYWKKSKFNCPMIPYGGDLHRELLRRADIEWAIPEVVAFLPDGTLLSNRGRELVGQFVGVDAFAPKKNENWGALVEEAQNKIKDRFIDQIKSIREDIGNDLYLNYYAEVYWLDKEQPLYLKARRGFIAQFKALEAKDKLDVMNSIGKIHNATLTPEEGLASPFWDMPDLFFAIGQSDDPESAAHLREQNPETNGEALEDRQRDWPILAYLLGSYSVTPAADERIVAKWRENADEFTRKVFENLFKAALKK